MTIVHVTASPCFGGVERQMLELGHELQDSYRSVFVSFKEDGRCRGFIEYGLQGGYRMHALQHDFPRMGKTYRELKDLVQDLGADLLCCHGYKANTFGLVIARQLGIPIVSVSHGWTAESPRVRVFEALDRRLLRWMDKVVCVSAGQAKKVRAAGVPGPKVQVIRDAVRSERFANVDDQYRARLESLFPEKPRLIVGAAGRLSPEKGFKHLVEAATDVLRMHPEARFVLFGDGPLRDDLARQIASCDLTGRFHLAGFTSDLDKYYPHLDLLVLPSYTEGLPNVVLEAFAAGVPVVATAVGGTPEVLQDGVNGYLVAAGDSSALAQRIADVLADDAQRRQMGLRGQQLVRERFSFASQAREYRLLLDSLVNSSVTAKPALETVPAGSKS